jgi:asparagine synthase (glutamine-hydrolysing)
VRYHQLEAVGLRTFSAENVVDFDGTLRASVKQQMMTDVPLGLFLSGGLDSYAVASAAVSAGQQPEAFTLGFADAAYDETAAADQYARYLGLNDHAVQFVLDETAIRSTLNAMGELLADASCFPLYQLSGFARKQVTVILAGDGADELLAGYDTYRAGEITPLLQMLPQAVRSTAAALVRHLPVDDSRYGLRMVASRLLAAADAGHARDHASFRLIFSEELKRRLYSPEMLHGTSGGDPVGEYAALVENAPDGSSYLAARQEADLVFHLPSILAKVDRMSMAHGLEVRVPFLGRDMVAFCKGLDDDAKRGWGRGKRILRKSLQGNIPAQGLRRRKTGFLPPVDSWFREKGPLHSVFAELLMTARGNLPALDWDQVESYWHEHRTGRTDGGFVLLGILQYINWSMKCRRL